MALQTGLWAVGVLGGLVLIFQYLLRFARDNKMRADELAERNRQQLDSAIDALAPGGSAVTAPAPSNDAAAAAAPLAPAASGGIQ